VCATTPEELIQVSGSQTSWRSNSCCFFPSKLQNLQFDLKELPDCQNFGFAKAKEFRAISLERPGGVVLQGAL
jgi:hypothetical protein